MSLAASAPSQLAADTLAAETMRTVTHVGPRRCEIGGVQTVLRDYEACPPDGTRLRFITTYTTHSRALSAVLFASALARILLTRRSVLGTVHVHVAQRGSVWRKAIVAGLCRWRAVPVVATVHASQLDDDLRRRPETWSRLLARCRAVGTLSCKAADGLIRLDPAARIERFPNRVPVGPRPAALPNAKRVLFAGAVCHRKGADVLLRAWPIVLGRHPDAELFVVGPPGDVMIARLPGVRVLGGLPPTQVRALLQRVDLAVLPSRSEGMPMFVLEAMAAARPVVATDIEDLAEVVGDGGAVVEPGCPVCLAEALSSQLDAPAESARRGRLNHERIRRDHDILHLGDDLRRLHFGTTGQVA